MFEKLADLKNKNSFDITNKQIPFHKSSTSTVVKYPNCKVHFNFANFLQVPSTQSINQNIKILSSFCVWKGKKEKVSRLVERKEIIWSPFKREGKSEMQNGGLIWYRRGEWNDAWNSWDLLVSRRLPKPDIRIFADAIGRIARSHSTPSLSHIPFASMRATKNDAPDKESHSFIAASRLISILIRFGILSSTNLEWDADESVW